MLTADGCRRRRQRLWDALDPKPGGDALALADPAHLRYFANFSAEPYSYGADFGGRLLVRKDGHGTLIFDNRMPSRSV